MFRNYANYSRYFFSFFNFNLSSIFYIFFNFQKSTNAPLGVIPVTLTPTVSIDEMSKAQLDLTANVNLDTVVMAINVWTLTNVRKMPKRATQKHQHVKIYPVVLNVIVNREWTVRPDRVLRPGAGLMMKKHQHAL